MQNVSSSQLETSRASSAPVEKRFIGQAEEILQADRCLLVIRNLFTDFNNYEGLRGIQVSLIRALHEDVNGDTLMNGSVQGIIRMHV